MYTYQYVTDSMTGQVSTAMIMRLPDNACIPFDEQNRDYVEYLAWIEAGNEPEPADV